jgi:hypothetical protein
VAKKNTKKIATIDLPKGSDLIETVLNSSERTLLRRSLNMLSLLAAKKPKDYGRMFGIKDSDTVTKHRRILNKLLVNFNLDA